MKKSTQVTHTLAHALNAQFLCLKQSSPVAIALLFLVGAGKQLVHYTATPVHMSDPVGLDEGGADLPSLLEPFLQVDQPTDDPATLLESDL